MFFAAWDCMCYCKRRMLWTLPALTSIPWLLFSKELYFLCFNKIACIHVFIFSYSINIYFRKAQHIVLKFYFCKAIDVMNILGTLAVISFSFFLKKKKKQQYVNRQKFLCRVNALLIIGLPWKLWELLYFLLYKHLQKEYVLSCATCCLCSVSILVASTKRCTSLNVSHQQHDKPRHFLCLPWDPHLCITFLEWKLFGAGTVS